jgi:hypothetical protein
MDPLTENQIRASFVNATRREVSQAVLPDLAGLAWDRLDHLGWRDRKAPLAAYVVLPLDGGPVGLLLRAGTPPASGVRRRALCSWCHDIVDTDASLYVARRAGAAGRQGNTVGTLICTEFQCSRNVRRPPTLEELGTTDDAARQRMIAERIEGLRTRSAQFAVEVLGTR